MPERHVIHARRRVKRMRKSTKFWITTGIIILSLFLILYVWSVQKTGELQDVPMPELGF